MSKWGFQLLLVWCACAAAPMIFGGNDTQNSPAASSPTSYTSCLYDFDKGEVVDCIQKSSNGELFVTKRVLRDLRFNSHGLAVLKSATNGWMYVSRAGRIVISGVPTMDNWADTFHDGLVRVTRKGKYGFSNPDGQLTILPTYDGAMNFDHGKAKVCRGCTSKCVDQECEYHAFSGGVWLEIDTKGNIVSRTRAEK